ncbi:MAG: sulfatase-like hydrolase/transferase, partial [Planctomycetaceae bacterium]|nr:sulfatase-like hydrolase/transferase [Planctomycetaceae bacterium]
MLKRWCGYGWILAISWLVLSAELQAAEKNAKPPNILFVFADDQAFNTIAALGNQEIRTPHLDRIVQDGMTFTH